jgi:hypothetical protein
MRTTIRLADEKRDSLLTLAQERGDRGVSRVIEEAVAFYLSERNKPVPVVQPRPEPGHWQRLGARLDRRVGDRPGFLRLVGALVRGGLSRLPLLRT